MNIPKVTNQWIHLVLNFIGPMREQGIEVFRDGALITNPQSYVQFQRSRGEGKLILGRWYVNMDSGYATIDVDEVVFFNRKLMAQEVVSIYNKD